MSKYTYIFIAIAVLVTVGFLVYVRNPRPFKITWASIVQDNREHYLDCTDMPFYMQTEKTISQHQDIIDKLKRVGGVIDVKAELVKCYTVDGSNYFKKGDLEIDYKSHAARKEVEKMIGDNFFGIPWRGHRI